MTTSRCILISGSPYFSLNHEIRDEDFVIACDAGYQHCLNSGIRPNLVMGDFDSYCNDLFEEGIPVETFPPEKDDTDTALALKYAIEAVDADEVVILGGTGARMDHFLANVSLLAFGAAQGVRCSMLDDDNQLYMLCGGLSDVDHIELSREDGWSVSLFSYSNLCEGVTTTGLEYSLKNASLENTVPLGISNVFSAEKATIKLDSGLLLIIMSRI